MCNAYMRQAMQNRHQNAENKDIQNKYLLEHTQNDNNHSKKKSTKRRNEKKKNNEYCFDLVKCFIEI